MKNFSDKLRELGFSRIVAGVWRWGKLPQSQWQILIQQAVELGITTFDHADIYGDYTCEEQFGQVLKANAALKSKCRVITKCGIKLVSAKRPDHRIKHYDTSAAHVLKSAETSLRLLGVEVIDLLLLHRPDPLMHPEEIAEAFYRLENQGKVKRFGVSNFTPAQLEMLQSFLDMRLVTNQIELSLFRYESIFNGTLDVLMKYRMQPMAWSPLGGGRYFASEETAKSLAITLQQLSEKYPCTESQLLLAWLLTHPSGIYPVVGTTRPERLEEAVGALALALERQDWFALLKAVTGKDVP